jgi:membrane protein
MYLSWAVVLFGAELTAALPEWRLALEDLGGPLPARQRLHLALRILAALQEDARHGGGGRTRRQLLDAVAGPERPFLDILGQLCAESYVVLTTHHRYVLGRDLLTVSLGDVVRLLDLGLASAGAEAGMEPWLRPIASRLSEIARAEDAALDLPLRAMLESGDGISVPQVAVAKELPAELAKN